MITVVNFCRSSCRSSRRNLRSLLRSKRKAFFSERVWMNVKKMNSGGRISFYKRVTSCHRFISLWWLTRVIHPTHVSKACRAIQTFGFPTVHVPPLLWWHVHKRLVFQSEIQRLELQTEVTIIISDPRPRVSIVHPESIHPTNVSTTHSETQVINSSIQEAEPPLRKLFLGIRPSILEKLSNSSIEARRAIVGTNFQANWTGLSRFN